MRSSTSCRPFEPTAKKPKPSTWECPVFNERIMKQYGINLLSFEPEFLQKALHVCKEKLGSTRLSKKSSRYDSVLVDALLDSLSGSVAYSKALVHSFLSTFSAQIIPMLKTYPRIKIWQIGCSSEDVTSSILKILHEAGLSERLHYYVTALTEEEISLQKIASLKNKTLTSKVSYFRFNYLSDSSFNEFQTIFINTSFKGLNKSGLERVLDLVEASLARTGYVGTYQFELIKKPDFQSRYDSLSEHRDWYQRKLRE